jgi:hypothetical protein
VVNIVGENTILEKAACSSHIAVDNSHVFFEKQLNTTTKEICKNSKPFAKMT